MIDGSLLVSLLFDSSAGVEMNSGSSGRGGGIIINTTGEVFDPAPGGSYILIVQLLSSIAEA